MGKQTAAQMLSSAIIFGKNSAMEPGLLHRKNVRHYWSKYPLAAKTELQSAYMDDLLDSVEGEEKGIELYHQLSALWEKETCMPGHRFQI